MLGNELNEESICEQSMARAGAATNASSKRQKRDSLDEDGGGRPTANEEEDSVVAEPPTPFAPEIFLQIASYLEPGTKTLANLTATCYDLYSLLTPHLMSKIGMNRKLKRRLDKWCDTRASGLVKNDESRLLSWGEKLSFVETFDADFGPGPWLRQMPNLTRLMMLIDNIAHAREFGCPREGDWPLPKLKELIVWLDDFELEVPGIDERDRPSPYLPFDFELNFPELNKLVVHGYYVQEIGLAADLGCPKLQSVEIRLIDDKWYEQPPHLPISFLSKIVYWEEHGGSWLSNFPASNADVFKPRTIVFQNLWNFRRIASDVVLFCQPGTQIIVKDIDWDDDFDPDDFSIFLEEFGNAHAQSQVTVQATLRATDIKAECTRHGIVDSGIAEFVAAWFEAMENPDRYPWLQLEYIDLMGSTPQIAEWFAAFWGRTPRQKDDDPLNRAAWAMSRWLKKQAKTAMN